MSQHCLVTPYSFLVQKCGNPECCGELWTPHEVRNLVIQRQPTPQLDTFRKGHFLPREQAVEEAKVTPGALTNLSDLPSAKLKGKKKSVSDAKKRDVAMSSNVGLKKEMEREYTGF